MSELDYDYLTAIALRLAIAALLNRGVPLKTIEQLLHYWQSDYDWRKVEARLNAYPNFING